MRNLTAEVSVINRLFTLAGTTMLLGLTMLLVVGEIWICTEFAGIKFWFMQSLWFVLASIIVSFIAHVAKFAVLNELGKKPTIDI